MLRLCDCPAHFVRSARCFISNDRRARNALATWQSSTPARGMRAPGDDEYNVIASGSERVQQ